MHYSTYLICLVVGTLSVIKWKQIQSTMFDFNGIINVAAMKKMMWQGIYIIEESYVSYQL